MLIDLESPLALKSYEILRDDRNRARVYAKIINLTNRPITAFDVMIQWIDRQSDRTDSIPYSVGPVNIPAHEGCTVSFLTDIAPEAERIEMAFVSATLEGQRELWQGDCRRIIEVLDPEPMRDAEREALRAVLGEEGEAFPIAQDAYWRCVCGCYNAKECEDCRHCGREKAVVLQSFTREQIMRGVTKNENDTSPGQAREPIMPFPFQEAEEKQTEVGMDSHDARELKLLLWQRSNLIRRTVTLLILSGLIILGSIFWNWLTESRQRVGEIIPPTPILETEPSITGYQEEE